LPDDINPSYPALRALIVSAYIKNHDVQAADLETLLTTVTSALANAGGPTPTAPQAPAANLRRLVSPGAIACAECGKKFRSLKRHLATAHDLTTSAYRAKWGLKRDHPMVAPDYAAVRSALAKSIGLGRRSARK
jgi:predicted transcriptional regulator